MGNITTDASLRDGDVDELVVLRVCRSGPLFNTGFLRRMLFAAVQHSMEDIQALVKTLICESDCTTLKSFAHGPSALANQGNNAGVGLPGQSSALIHVQKQTRAVRLCLKVSFPFHFQ